MKRDEREVAIITVLVDGGIGEALVPTTEKNVVLFNNTDSGELDQPIGLFITDLRV